MHSWQTSVEIRIGQAGQSHTGHNRAVTATGFPPPCPGSFSRTPLPSLSVLTCCYHLYRFAAFASKRSDLHKVSYSHGTRTILNYRHNYAVQKKNMQNACKCPDMHTAFGHCNIQVQFLNGSEHHQMGENACAYSHTEMRKKYIFIYRNTYPRTNGGGE